jgi:hypothetical protein
LVLLNRRCRGCVGMTIVMFGTAGSKVEISAGV